MLLEKAPARVEFYNDIDSLVVKMFRLIRSKGEQLERLCADLAATPFSREELTDSRRLDGTEDDIEAVRKFLVRSWYSFSGSVNNWNQGWKLSVKDSKRLVAWNSLPDRIRDAAERLKLVHIEQTDAVKLMLSVDSPDALHFVDPPYVMDTINFREKQVYSSAFDIHNLVDLLACLKNLKGRVILSGYRHPIYDEALDLAWMRLDIPHLTQRHTVKTECLWLNFVPGVAQ